MESMQKYAIDSDAMFLTMNSESSLDAFKIREEERPITPYDSSHFRQHVQSTQNRLDKAKEHVSDVFGAQKKSVEVHSLLRIFCTFVPRGKKNETCLYFQLFY